MTPISSDPAARARQIAALRPGAGQAKAGDQRRLRHGGTARVALGRLDAAQAEIFYVIEGDVPLREADGSLPRADAGTVMLLAQALCRLADVNDYLRRRGIEDEKGRLRHNDLKTEAALRRESSRYMDKLGMSIEARRQLGLALLRGDVGDLDTEVEAGRSARLERGA